MPTLSPVVIHLLKGVLYKESEANLWASLLALQSRVRDYVRIIGLELVLNEAEGYAFLRSRGEDDPETEESAKPVPRLIARRRLSFPVSLLLALLRKRMAEADTSGGVTCLVLTRGEIASLMRVFFAEISNEAKVVDQIEAHIGKTVELGFLRNLKAAANADEPSFEVMRILKAFVDAQWLAEFDQRLSDYAKHAASKGGADNE